MEAKRPTRRDVQKMPLAPLDQIAPSPAFMVNGRPVDAEKPAGAIRKYLDVWCGTCEEWRHLEAKRMGEAAREAKRYGWKLTEEHGWICPACAAAPAETPNDE
jgi:hypothetical protein